MRRICALIALMLLFITGCSSPTRDAPLDFPAVTVSPALTPYTSALTPSTPAPTASPAPVPSRTPSPSATPDAKPSASPQTGQTAETSSDTDRVTLTEGFYYTKLNDAVKKRITGISYPKGKKLKITYDDLRYVRVKYYDFDGKEHTDGELIVNKKLADEVLKIFRELYLDKYAFTSIKLVDDYGQPGDDALSMAANNTSAFNYRDVAGTKTLSMHSYGAAIDVNPRINPYVKANGSIVPTNGKEYADRTKDFPGKIDHNDLGYKVFKKYGWSWGGDWKTSKDYQHFSKSV